MGSRGCSWGVEGVAGETEGLDGEDQRLKIQPQVDSSSPFPILVILDTLCI